MVFSHCWGMRTTFHILLLLKFVFRFFVYIHLCQHHKKGDEEIHLTVMTSEMEVAPTNKLLIGMKLTTSTNIAVL